MADRDPASFAGNPNPPAPKLTAPAAPPPSGGQLPESSAGSGALPPSTGPASPSTPSENNAGSISFSVVATPEGGHEAYTNDGSNGPQKLFNVRLPPADVKSVLDASGASYDDGLKSYENVPEETVKALAQGRPTPAEYWQSQWGASEAEAVRNLNGLQFLSGDKTAAQALSDNHLPTLKAHRADRPDMAWFGKGGILGDFLQHPADALARAGESAVGSVIKQLQPLMEVAMRAGAVGFGAGAAVGAVQPELAPAALGVGASTGVMFALKDMMRGQVAAEGLEQGLPEDLIKEKANVAGALSAAIMVPGFEGMTLLGKAAFLDELAASSAAKRVIAHMAVGGAAGGSVMAAQQAVTELLNHVVAETAHRPDLLEDPKNALKNIVMAGLGGAAFGAGAVAFAEGMRKAFDALKPEEKNTPEGKKVSASIKRAEEPSVHDAMERHLAPPEVPTPNPAQEPGAQGSPASDQSVEETPAGSLVRTPSASEPPSRNLTPSTQEEPSTSNSSSSEDKSISPGARKSKPLLNIAEREYVPAPEFGAIPKGSMAAAGKEVLQRYSEIFHGWLVRGAHLVDDLKTSAPEAEAPGVTWYLAAKGDAEQLKTWRADPELAPIHDALDKALNLSDESKANTEKLQRFYAEWESESRDNKVFENGIENFQARYWQKVGEENEKPKWDWKSPFKQTTSHAKQRVFASEVDAIRAGYLPRVNAYDAAGVYSEEMSAVNSNRLTANSLIEQGLAKWAQEAPAGGEWARMGELEKQRAVVLENGEAAIMRYRLYGPPELADQLRAITEPDWTKKIPVLQGAGRVQGIIKTGNLALSAFHPITLAAQGAATGNWANLFSSDIDARMASPHFAADEAVAVDHGVITSEIAANQDIMRNLKGAGEEGLLAKITNAPGVSQALDAMEDASNWIFGKQQRLYKVTDFTRIFGDWQQEHPNSPPDVSKAAGREIARYVNATYGSLNWTAMGMMKATSSVFRGLVMAPDWLTSAGSMVKMATTERGLGGELARGYFVRAALLGTAALIGANELTTGHGPQDNPKGHKLDIEVAKDVWFSPFRGPLGEVAKLGSLAEERGLPGVAQYGANKAAPLLRVAMSAGLNTLYSGRPIVPSRASDAPHINPETGRTIKTRPIGPIEGSYDFMKWLITSLTPTPFGVASLAEYLHNEEEPTFLGAFTVGTGITRYAPPSKAKAKPKKDPLEGD